MTQTPGTPAEEMFPIISVNFDFYVGMPSDLETGRWEVRTVQNDVIGRTLTDVNNENVWDAREVLRGDLEEAGTEFLFITSAGYSAGYNFAENEAEPDTQIHLKIKILADNKKALLEVLGYLLESVNASEDGLITLDHDTANSAIDASSWLEDVDPEDDEAEK